jgi:hypothetical protein
MDVQVTVRAFEDVGGFRNCLDDIEFVSHSGAGRPRLTGPDVHPDAEDAPALYRTVANSS